jgi:hypothetical protein
MIRIVSTPFVYPDGQIQVGEEFISEPETIELDGAWVHVVKVGSFGDGEKIKSFPAHEIQRIEWDYEGEAA